MKIAHVVTYLSADHAFGGPLSVALTQTSELARRGHEVDLYCGWDGVTDLDVEGVRVRKFPVHRVVPGAGFSGLVAPGLTRALLGDQRYDVVHVHLARDLITLRAASRLLQRQIPYVVQPHGMVMPDQRLRARVTDRIATRQALGGAAKVLALTKEESAGLASVARAPVHLARLGNGVPFQNLGADSSPALTEPADVVFLARLHPRKRVLVFAAMARLLVDRGVAASYAVVGPDEGELAALRTKLRDDDLESHVTYEGAISYEDVPSRLARANVFVLPSVNEPFGMTILEALSVGTPTVVTESLQISDMLQRYGAAIVTDGSPVDLADAVERILTDPELVHSLKEGSRTAMAEQFGIGNVVNQLQRIYAEALA